MLKLFSALVATILFTSQSLFAAERPDINIGFQDIKMSGDCTIEARITNWEIALKYSYQLPEGTIGFGSVKCKDGSRAYFTIHESIMGEKLAGVHAVNLSGYIDGTANDIYGTYGFYKNISVLPAFWSSYPLPLGYGILAFMKSPTSKPMILIGMAMGIEISEHIGAMQIKKAPAKRVKRLFEIWEGRIVDGKNPFDKQDGP